MKYSIQEPDLIISTSTIVSSVVFSKSSFIDQLDIF